MTRVFVIQNQTKCSEGSMRDPSFVGMTRARVMEDGRWEMGDGRWKMEDGLMGVI